MLWGPAPTTFISAIWMSVSLITHSRSSELRDCNPGGAVQRY